MALRASIGQYYSVDSPVHRLDPRVKLVSALAFMVSCFFVDSPSTLLLAGLAIGLAVAFARVPARRLLSHLKRAGTALLMVTHSMEDVAELADQVVALACGRRVDPSLARESREVGRHGAAR